MPDETTKVAYKESQDYLAIRRSLASLVAGKTTHRSGGEMGRPANAYTDRDRWEAERKLLLNYPLFAGFSVQLPEVGDTLSFDHAGPQIILIRQADGSLKGFLNMCTHRGARIVNDCERRTRLTCPFHAWTFGLDGQLKTTPGREFFDGDKMPARNLIDVPVAEWEGLIFVRPDPNGAPIEMETYLGGYAPHLRGLDAGNATYVATSRLDVRSNWKYVLDTFSESYHLPALHTASFGLDYFPNLLHYDRFGLHHRFALANKNFRGTLGVPEAEWPEVSMAVIGFVFPNTVISIIPMSTGRHCLQIAGVYPGETVDRSFSVTATAAMSDACSSDELAEVRQIHEMIIRVNSEEDFLLAEDAQRNLVYAPSDFSLTYGAIEPAAQDFHRHLSDAIADMAPPHAPAGHNGSCVHQDEAA